MKNFSPSMFEKVIFKSKKKKKKTLTSRKSTEGREHWARNRETKLLVLVREILFSFQAPISSIKELNFKHILWSTSIILNRSSVDRDPGEGHLRNYWRESSRSFHRAKQENVTNPFSSLIWVCWFHYWNGSLFFSLQIKSEFFILLNGICFRNITSL